MTKSPRNNPLRRCLCACCDDGSGFRADGPSRRSFLTAGAALAAAAPMLSTPVHAQSADPELARLQAQRRILIKGGIVLTLDRQVGDFAQADVLIEDGKIREIRPNIAVSDAAVVDATNHIIVPGLRRHPQPFLSGRRAQHPVERAAQSRLQPRHPDHADAGLRRHRCLRGRAGLGARLHRHGHDHHRRHLPVQPYAGAQRRHDPRAAGVRHPGGLLLSPRRRPGASISAGHQAPAAHLLQLQGPAAHARADDQSQRAGLFARPRGRRAGGAASGRRRPQQAGAGPRHADAPGRRIHPLPGHQRHDLEAAQGHRRQRVAVRHHRHGHGPRHADHPGGARPRLPPEPLARITA